MEISLNSFFREEMNNGYCSARLKSATAYISATHKSQHYWYQKLTDACSTNGINLLSHIIIKNLQIIIGTGKEAKTIVVNLCYKKNSCSSISPKMTFRNFLQIDTKLRDITKTPCVLNLTCGWSEPQAPLVGNIVLTIDQNRLDCSLKSGFLSHNKKLIITGYKNNEKTLTTNSTFWNEEFS